MRSFVELSTILLAVPGVQYILPEKLSQDPIERFFGKQRAAGGHNDNPTVQGLCNNTVSLRVQGSAALEPVRGNCEAKKKLMILSMNLRHLFQRGKGYQSQRNCLIVYHLNNEYRFI